MKVLHYFFEISMTVLQIVFICMKVAGNSMSWNLALTPFYLLLVEALFVVLSQIVVIGSSIVINKFIENGMIEASSDFSELKKKFSESNKK